MFSDVDAISAATKSIDISESDRSSNDVHAVNSTLLNDHHINSKSSPHTNDNEDSIVTVNTSTIQQK